MTEPSDKSPPRKRVVRLERASGVATIVIENPPVNALGGAVRQGILAALSAAEADPATRAIVIAAAGRTFPAGADITEFGAPAIAPDLPDLCNRVEACPKPVIACLHGTVLGGGLELAMAAHYRVALAGTLLGLPEIKLGLLPGAGGTQRAPRLMGVTAALEIMLTGEPVPAEQAEATGLLDLVVPGEDMLDLRSAARLLAEEVDAPRPTKARRARLRDGAKVMAELAAMRQAVAAEGGGVPPATGHILECVEAALLMPFEAGLAREREAFLECLEAPTSKGLRHAFFAERRATKFPELQQAAPRKIESVGILGGGMMGSGIAICCLDAGLPVTLVEQGEAGVSQALDRIGAHYQRGVERGRISEAQGAAALTHLNLTADPSALSRADLVIEALPEEEELKRTAFTALSSLARKDAILASNTSYQPIDALAAAAGRPATTLGLHFFAPAQRMKLVEIGVTQAADPEAVVSLHAFAKRLGKLPVRSAAAPGYIGNRLLMKMRAAADRALLQGALPAQVDEAMRRFGFAMGPYQALDLSGLEIARSRRRALAAAAEPDPFYLTLGDRMCDAGLLGQKTGAGYYVYAPGTPPQPNAEVERMLVEERRQKGIEARRLSDRNIRDLILLSMVNEGARVVEEGIAARPSDVDCVMLHGFGYPRARGGPMRDGDATTPFEIARRIDILAKEDPSFWQVSPLLCRLARERQLFDSLN